MTNQEAKILINRTIPKGNSAIDIQLRGALELAMNALGAIEQFKWERNVAIEQLEELGISFGEKIDGVYLSKKEYEELLEYKYMYEDLCQ